MTNRLRNWTGSALCAASFLVACTAESGSGIEDTAAAALALAPAPKVDRVTMHGPGCDGAPSSAIGITGDRSSFRIKFDEFKVSADEAGSTTSECEVSVVLDAPAGVAYAPAGLKLSARSSTAATLSSTASWTSAPDDAIETTTTLSRGGLRTSDALDAPTLLSACSGERELRIKLKLSTTGESGAAALERLSNLTFHAQDCGDGPSDQGRSDASLPPLDAGTVDAASTEVDAGGTDASSSDSANQVAVSNVVASGSGCPAGSTAVEVPDGQDSFEVDFNRFSASLRPQATSASEGCIVTLQVAAPAGKTVALERLTLRGTASLPPGATARVTTYYNFIGSGSQSSATRNTPLAGQFEGPFEAAVEFGEGERLFRSCAQPTASLNVRMNLSVRGGEGVDGASASIVQLDRARFVVRDCE